ncbi:inactive rhomboid protein 1-like [Babylonia areolata]|uniref:inactive rhomboid protein 1-like n=1 Tax=Babylonia areolata TaxID=304850 RepID=UPI003FCF7F0F
MTAHMSYGYSSVVFHSLDLRLNGVPQHTAIRLWCSTAQQRMMGVGVLGKYFGYSLHRPAFTKSVTVQLDNMDDHRPFFTYWVTFVQILVFIVAILVYGVAPIGVGKEKEQKMVRLSSLALEVKEYVEQKNLWIGPRKADLIHLGAKYSPCMRDDPNLRDLLNLDRKMENQSACCVRNDGSGCVQRLETKCDILSTWKKWRAGNDTGPGGRVSGSVCGQDPLYCITPASAAPFEWPDSIVDWPVCTKTRKQNVSYKGFQDRHMSCELLGRPCCYGIKGECWITTREHCNLLRGRFHDDKFLCAQTSCFEELCGMIPFSNSKKPDQIYRLWTSLFLHAGVMHLVVSILFQMWIMRDIEKLTGAMRLSIIYISSGMAGNLASSIFLPYHVDAGPSGSQFGVLACLLVEVLQSYQMYRSPRVAIFKTMTVFFTLLAFGLLPWFDNWSHLFGFGFGFLLAFALIPYVSFGKFDRRRKILTIVICLSSAAVFYIVLLLLFYVSPLTECKLCIYFNCIPFTEGLCEDMYVSLNNRSSYDSDF